MGYETAAVAAGKYASVALANTVSGLEATVGGCTTQGGKTECTGLHQVANSASSAAAAAQSTANSASTAAATAQSTANSASTAASNAASSVSALEATVGGCSDDGRGGTNCTGMAAQVNTVQATVQQQANTISQLSAAVAELSSQVAQIAQQTTSDK